MLDLGILVLRLGIGIMFTAHGLRVAFGLFGWPTGIKGFAGVLSGLGFAPAIFWSYAAGYTQLLGGLLLIIGLQTRLSATLLLIFIVIAAIKVHIAKGFFIMNGGFEYTFVIAAACLALVFLGSGKFRIFRG